MLTRHLRRALWVVISASVVLATPARAESPLDAVTKGETEARVERNDSIATFTLSDPATRAWGMILASEHPLDITPHTRSQHLFLLIRQANQTETMLERLVALAHRIAARDGGLTESDTAVHSDGPSSLSLPIAILIAIVSALASALRRRGRVRANLRLPHLIPVILQLTIFAYWSLYWPGVALRVPSILQQIVLAYAVDAAVMFGRFGEWPIGFGPLPIALSSNLFAWFSPVGSVVVIVVAVASRAFIRRGTRHVVNPSAMGLTVAGLLSFFLPSMYFRSVFHELNVAPNMGELLILLALLPQLRFRIVLVSVGAALGLRFAGSSLALPGILLTFALFATDPATAPVKPLGQLLYGALIGAGFQIFSLTFRHFGQADDLAKVFPVPIANALVPWFDHLGTRLEQRLAWLGPKWNLAHVSLWLLLAAPEVGASKAHEFEGALHWSYRTPLVVRDADDVPRCANNPIFCRPFTFGSEIAAWIARGRSPNVRAR